MNTEANRMLIFSIFTLLISAVFFLSCRADSLSTPPFDTRDLEAMPQKVEISGREFQLSASLWRDFMPISPPDGRPLAAVITITAVDSMALPASLDADMVWVVYGSKIWGAPLSGEKTQERPYQFSRNARGGPKWGPGVDADVVVRILDIENTYLLRVPDVPIVASE